MVTPDPTAGSLTCSPFLPKEDLLETRPSQDRDILQPTRNICPERSWRMVSPTLRAGPYPGLSLGMPFSARVGLGLKGNRKRIHPLHWKSETTCLPFTGLPMGAIDVS